MRARHPDVGQDIPDRNQGEAGGDVDMFVERYRVARRAHGWKVLAAGSLALAIGLVGMLSDRPDPFRAVYLLLIGTSVLVVGLVMLHGSRRHKPPRARALGAKR